MNIQVDAAQHLDCLSGLIKRAAQVG